MAGGDRSMYIPSDEVITDLPEPTTVQKNVLFLEECSFFDKKKHIV